MFLKKRKCHEGEYNITKKSDFIETIVLLRWSTQNLISTESCDPFKLKAFKKDLFTISNDDKEN